MKKSLIKMLEDYGNSDYYPFHMPGHKRMLEVDDLPAKIDITEIDGFDNLHHPHGILLQAQKRAASLYGVEESFFLINGSTCGILAAISAAVSFEGSILFARNSHRSAYHGNFLRSLKPWYVYPRIVKKYGICGGICPEDVQRALDEAMEMGEKPEAFYITSPTYEGMVSNIEKIADIIHKNGLVLIVDEAHGAHFGIGGSYFPESAALYGADIVIQSLHKTMPSLTQTAILHVQGDRIDREKLRKYLQIYQSSSPSYPLMASIEYCIHLMEEKKELMFDLFTEKLQDFYDRVKGLRALYVMQPRKMAGKNSIWKMDPSKICIFTNHSPWTGMELYDKLSVTYHLQLEMAAENYVIAMTSVLDTREGFERLVYALSKLDEEACDKMDSIYGHNASPGRKTSRNFQAMYKKHISPCVEMTSSEAEEHIQEIIDWRDSIGRISGEYRYVYPPGIPFLVPGERITEQVWYLVGKNRNANLQIEGEEYGRDKISVIKE